MRTKNQKNREIRVAPVESRTPVVDSIVLDQRRVLPVSSVQDGCYGIRDVALSVPTVVGREGVVARHEIDLWPKEMQGLRNSGNALRQTLTTVMQRI